MLLRSLPCRRRASAHLEKIQVVALSRIAGLKYASMSIHIRETALRQSLLFANDRMVPRGIERADGEWLVSVQCTLNSREGLRFRRQVLAADFPQLRGIWDDS